MGMSLIITSTPYIGEVLKAPMIHRAACLCIFPRIFRGYDREAQL